MKTTIERATADERARRIEQKIERVDARIADGDLHLRQYRRSLQEEMRGPRMSAAQIQRKLIRLDARIASGDTHLKPFRRSLLAQMRAILRQAGGH